MVDELEKSAIKLAQSEREEVEKCSKTSSPWNKNPHQWITHSKFSTQVWTIDPNVKQNDYSETLIQQIDTMSAVASAFSNPCSMPAQQNETWT
jgi:hypothetical protein